ncbi:MAG: hypothetical protein SO128_05735 [Clostridium cadaveris]|uniref:Uncharacterized protein n=1 Tax=Clostridium cadaveris TaxID=1529 RepID=A0A1I2PMQ8_9CLOT|nr:hypothetical protein [Clostridium cadaveris]MDU4951140.1 hypothetical protein [Clostridium sp.]MDM8311950.1 hypothetical protein [Clostridium cadaveris]MDY4948854.1 hypothetical protein [Clostridium cadaveris]NME63094.1 hypothetical protein [Clostridium cadaveris]NWK10077.1 hypothetical protein [Clostridium cadaveris]
MAKKTSANNDMLKEAKKKSSAKIYAMILHLANEERQDLAELVMKVDYLLQYTSACIKAKDYDEAQDTMTKVEKRLQTLEDEGVDITHLKYLHDGIKNKIK